VDDKKSIEKYIGDLTNILMKYSPDIQITAARRLGEIGDAKAVPALINAFESDCLDVRDEAAEALYKIGELAFPMLIDALKDNKLVVRDEAARTLGMVVSKIADTGDYSSALKIIKDSTAAIMKIYSGEKDRDSLEERRKRLKPFVELTEKIHAKMNHLDRKEPIKWQKPIAKAPAKKVNKRVLAK